MRISPRVLLAGFGVAAALASAAPARAALILDLSNPVGSVATAPTVHFYNVVGTVYNTGSQPVTLNQLNYNSSISDAAGDTLEVDPVGLSATVPALGSYTGTLLVYTLSANQPTGTYDAVRGGGLPTVTVGGFAANAPSVPLSSNATPYAAVVTSAVPEPATTGLIAAAGVTALRRRRPTAR